MSDSLGSQPETDKARLKAFHEAGHAVEAHLGGLGVVHVRLDPKADVRTAEKERLESADIDLVAPPRPLTQELLGFYQADIRVCMAGPLAQFRFQVPEATWQDMTGADVNLGSYGGGLDLPILRHEVAILRRHAPFEEQQYITAIQAEVWADTLERVELIAKVAEELLKARYLTGNEITAFMSQK